MFLILAAVVLGSADDKNQHQDLDLSDKFNRIAREAENSSSQKKNKKKNEKIKRKKNRAGKKRKASLNRGKKQKVNKSKAQKKRGEKKKERRNKRMKKRGEKKKERRNKRMNKGGKQKKEKKRNKNGKVRQKGNKRRGKKKNGNKIKKKNAGNMRNRRRNSRKTRKNRSSSLANCYRQTVFMMKIWKDVVSNFQKQNARMKSQKSIGERKTGKKGLFSPTAFKLIDIGGGNRSNLSCGGIYGSRGAKQLGNLTKTLFDCELNVNTSCNPANFPQPNTTFIEACETSTTSFVTQV